MTGEILARSGEGWKSGPIGFAVILVLCVACYFLFKSMSMHMRRVREDFPTATTPPPTMPLPAMPVPPSPTAATPSTASTPEAAQGTSPATPSIARPAAQPAPSALPTESSPTDPPL